MNTLPPELVTAVAMHLPAQAALALSMTCKHLARICAETVHVSQLHVDTDDRIEMQIAQAVRRRFRGVHHLRLSYSTYNLPDPAMLPRVKTALTISSSLTRYLPVKPIDSAQLAVIAGTAKRIEVRWCRLSPAADAQSQLATTVAQLTTLVLRCPYANGNLFQWPLHRWVDSSLSTLTLASWGGTSEQWKTLFDAVPRLQKCSVTLCPHFETAACAHMFDVCHELHDVGIFDCNFSLMYEDALKAANVATALTQLDFSRSMSELDELGHVDVALLRRNAAVLKRLTLVGIDGPDVETDALYWLYENCDRLRRCHTDRNFAVHAAADIRRRELHPSWARVNDMWNFG